MDIFLGFVYVGLSSIGGAAGPLRYVLVVRRKWLSEGEFSEVFGIAQVLPGATGANVAAMVADRFGRFPAVLAGLAGFCLPSMFVAIGLLSIATRLSASSPRFVAAETAVTAAVAGLFIGNGTRLARDLWTRAHDRRRWRTARLGIAVAGIVLIVAYHVWIPAAVLILASLSLALEWAEREAERRQTT
jgi:chromate transporter